MPNDQPKQPPATEAALPDANRVGWFRAMRTPEAMELLTTAPNAFCLAYVIGYRGQYRDGFNRHNLELGEALLGDHRNYGMSERQYRTAKQQLANWHFATFKATSKGTIGKLIDTRLFSIFRVPSDGQKDNQATDERRTDDDYRERKNGKNLSAISFEVRACEKSPTENRMDWNGLTTREKMLKELGSAEIGSRPDWLTRLEKHPESIEEIVNKMHAEKREGKIIKNPGAYAETLWKKSR